MAFASLNVDLVVINLTNMGFDLTNGGDSFRYSEEHWRRVLDLAWGHGWNPKGTEPPSHQETGEPIQKWDGDYFSNDGQAVSFEDSQNLADALEKAVADKEILKKHQGLTLHRFILFCRDGGFTIW